MDSIIRLTSSDGTPIEFVDKIIGQGAMKEVYFSPDRSYVVGFLKNPPTATDRDRLFSIVGIYRERIFTPERADYWKNYYCWPTHLVEWNGRLGIVAPAYPSCYFFEDGNLKDKEKEGKWFASAKLRNLMLTPAQKGSWKSHLAMCLKIARGVRRLHAAGLAHSDLSYKNVLVDPASGQAILIDLDGLVVPQKYPPEVLGTPDFIAPEVLSTQHLPFGDPHRAAPCIATDRHALAVLIYMYLLYRHPLRGAKVYDTDPQRDEILSMGSMALFVEHPTDASNRPDIANMHPGELPQGDVGKRPYTLCGPYLKPLFDRAFIEGLHDPAKRPSADDWEQALLRTFDSLLPCQNPSCHAKWFAFDPQKHQRPVCPFCGKPYMPQVPVLEFYMATKPGQFHPEGRRLVLYDNLPLYLWHVCRSVTPNENLGKNEQDLVADVHFHQGRWILVNRAIGKLSVISGGGKTTIPVGTPVELAPNTRLLFEVKNRQRMAVVEVV